MPEVEAETIDYIQAFAVDDEYAAGSAEQHLSDLRRAYWLHLLTFVVPMTLVCVLFSFFLIALAARPMDKQTSEEAERYTESGTDFDRSSSEYWQWVTGLSVFQLCTWALAFYASLMVNRVFGAVRSTDPRGMPRFISFTHVFQMTTIVLYLVLAIFDIVFWKVSLLIGVVALWFAHVPCFYLNLSKLWHHIAEPYLERDLEENTVGFTDEHCTSELKGFSE